MVDFQGVLDRRRALREGSVGDGGCGEDAGDEEGVLER